MTQTDKRNGERQLAVLVMGDRRPGLTLELVSDISKRGCKIIDCHVMPLGEAISISLRVSGNWSALGKLESTLPNLAKQQGIHLHLQNISADNTTETEGYRPYTVEVVAPSRDDLIPRVLDFFNAQNIRLGEMDAQAYNSSHTGASMCTMTLIVYVPVNQHPQALREAYLDFCDEINADGIFDPIKT